ncbi:GTPase family protein [Planctomicrobium sp. SH661]|uniref:GTPase family protein n=1 Tax=Planctomicrobium sp. SH661 TaxID=3448124 RepID=UPI003F5C22ED
MFSRRSLILAALITLPVLLYLGLGAYALWQTGWFAYTFWILPAFWLITWIVAVVWKPSQPLLAEDLPHPRHFTPRDESAMDIVRRYQEQVDVLTTEQLTDPGFYLKQSQHLARDLSVHYHPRAEDPISSLTIPEVLAAVRLAVDDMERWLLDSVPGSQLVTIRQWQWLQHAPKWVRRAQNAAWAVGVLLNPANALKYLTSEVTVGPISQELQTEFLAAVYLRFTRQLGFYLIEMNSGRLRGGADRYRQTFGSPEQVASGPSQAQAAELVPESLTVAFVGQVKAGKSSLVNALIGSRAAKSDVLPATSQVERYQFTVPETDVQLTLLDTPGYADAGATKKQLAEMQQALRSADVLLLVMAANSPARSADRELMDQLREWYAAHSELKPAPVVICLTHIDLLSPVMEWKPPYHWHTPTSRKEESIHAAVEHVQGLFSDVTTSVVPVCSDVERNRQASIIEELLPALLQVLNEGQIAAILRAYHHQLNRERLQRFMSQITSSGKNLLRIWVEERLLAPPRNQPPATPPAANDRHN